LIGVGGERVVPGVHLQFGESGDAVHTAGGEQIEPRSVLFAIFEQVDGASEVVLDQLPAAGFAVHARQHAGVGGGVEDPVAFWQGVDVALVADITMPNIDSEVEQGLAIEVAAGAGQVVDANDFVDAVGGGERFGKRRADEAADSGD